MDNFKQFRHNFTLKKVFYQKIYASEVGKFFRLVLLAHTWTCTGEVADHTYRRTVPYLPTHTIILVDTHSHTCRNTLPYMLLTEAEEPIQQYSLQIAIYNTLKNTPSFLCGQFKNFHSIPYHVTYTGMQKIYCKANCDIKSMIMPIMLVKNVLSIYYVCLANSWMHG